MKPFLKDKIRIIEFIAISIAIPLLMILSFQAGRLFQESIQFISSPVSEASIGVNRQADTHGGLAFEMTEAISVSAYNLLEEQTDNTPCLSASGIDLCNHDFEEFDWYEPFDHLPDDGWSHHSMGVIACPSYYPFYTEEKILFQFEFSDMGHYYICLDRMGEEYRDKEYFDVLIRGKNAKQKADEFGRKYNVDVKIYEL